MELYIKEIDSVGTLLEQYTYAYLDNQMSYNTWSNLFEGLNEELNEGLTDKIAAFAENKILPVLEGVYKKLESGAIKFSDKVIKVLTKIYNFIKPFFQKTPETIKIIMLVIVLLLFSFGVSNAAEEVRLEGENIEQVKQASNDRLDYINACLGILNLMDDDMKQKMGAGGSTSWIEAQAYLVDLRDGKIDNKWSVKAIHIVDNVRNLLEEAKDAGADIQAFILLGETVLGYTYNRIEYVGGGGHTDAKLHYGDDSKFKDYVEKNIPVKRETTVNVTRMSDDTRKDLQNSIDRTEEELPEKLHKGDKPPKY